MKKKEKTANAPKLKTGEKVGIILCLIPAFVTYTYVVFLPIVRAIYYSFFNWSGGPKMEFFGLKNYQVLLKDRAFWSAFSNNLTITILCLIGQIGIAFVLASLLNTRLVKFKSLHRVVTFFPSTVSAVIVGFVWMFIFNYDYGLVNTILRNIGLGQAASAWLDNPSSVIFVVSIPLVWQYIGYYTVIILAGMTAIDKSIYEVAELDGASSVRQAISITLPLIKNTLMVAVMLCISGNMKIFDHIYVMTNGGPGTSSSVMALEVYKTTFIKNRYGYASAMSVAIMVLSLLIIGIVQLVVNLVTRRKNYE